MCVCASEDVRWWIYCVKIWPCFFLSCSWKNKVKIHRKSCPVEYPWVCILFFCRGKPSSRRQRVCHPFRGLVWWAVSGPLPMPLGKSLFSWKLNAEFPSCKLKQFTSHKPAFEKRRFRFVFTLEVSVVVDCRSLVWGGPYSFADCTKFCYIVCISMNQYMYIHMFIYILWKILIFNSDNLLYFQF